jgi:Zn-dependent M32 family carboxypeptidase
MKFYSEVTKNLYDTMEDLRAAEKEITQKDLEKDVDEIVNFIKESVALDQKATKKMKELDTKYGAGTALKEVLGRFAKEKRKIQNDAFPNLTTSPFFCSIHTDAKSKTKYDEDDFLKTLDAFLGKNE